MSKAIDDLMHEHEAIMFTLRVLGKITSNVKIDSKSYLEDIKNLISFLKEFADKCHHGKEEGILFPTMEEYGIPKENGPIGAMLQEHDQGRKYIREMTDSIQDKSLLIDQFIDAGNNYISLLSKHIEKENTILFPMAEKRILKNIMENVYEKFEEHEEKVIGKGRHEELHKMLDKFEEKYIL